MSAKYPQSCSTCQESKSSFNRSGKVEKEKKVEEIIITEYSQERWEKLICVIPLKNKYVSEEKQIQ